MAMEMTDYERIIREQAEHVFEVMDPHTADADMMRLRDAFMLAKRHTPHRCAKRG